MWKINYIRNSNQRVKSFSISSELGDNWDKWVVQAADIGGNSTYFVHISFVFVFVRTQCPRATLYRTRIRTRFTLIAHFILIEMEKNKFILIKAIESIISSFKVPFRVILCRVCLFDCCSMIVDWENGSLRLRFCVAESSSSFSNMSCICFKSVDKVGNSDELFVASSFALSVDAVWCVEDKVLKEVVVGAVASAMVTSVGAKTVSPEGSLLFVAELLLFLNSFTNLIIRKRHRQRIVQK